LQAAVVGLEQDALMGVRLRKSFGPRVFWGSVVGCYWVSGGLFYKVSFDDGDVDILSQDEVLQDAQAAKKHAKENPQINEKDVSPVLEDYWRAGRQHSLKRKRDGAGDNLPPGVCRVTLWGQRLYASIYTNAHNETFVKELLKAEDGQVGEMEASGKVQVGDMILAVNKTRALGLTSIAVAELIRKPTRPVTITFYRPSVQQRGAAQAPATTEQTQTQQEPVSAQFASVPTMQQVPPAPAPAQRPVPTFTVPPSTFPQPAPLAQGLARQWTQPSQSQGLPSREIIRRRLEAARQTGFLPGYPMGVYARGSAAPAPAPPQASPYGVPPAHGGNYQAQQQYMQSVLERAATRISSGFNAPAGQQAQPMHRPQTAVPASSSGFHQPPRTLYEQVQQMRVQRNSRPTEVSDPPPAKRRSEAPFAVISQGPPDSTQALSDPNPAPRSDRMSAGNAHVPRAGTSASAMASSSGSTARSSLSFVSGVEAIAALAEKDPKAASQAMEAASRARGTASQVTSFLSPSEPAATSQTGSFLSPSGPPAERNPPTARTTEAASHPTSFLSPNDFNVEASMPLREERSPATAPLKPEPVESNVSLVSVQVQRRRLYLTLGMQGTLVAVTSFVKDEFGKAGEVELSGKVLLGDVLVRVDGTVILPGTTPSDVAEVVNLAPRPMTLHFERASWDILDGKE
jgi:hypothetical protein